MNYAELVFSIGIYVVSYYIFSTFLLPQIQRLKELKSKLNNFELVRVPNGGLSAGEIAKLKEIQKSQIEELHKIFSEYSIEYIDFKKILNSIRDVLVSMAVTIIVLGYIYLANNNFDFKRIDSYMMPFLFYIPIVFFITYRSLLSYIPTPETIMSLPFLLIEKDIDPASLFNANEIRVSSSINKSHFEKTNKDDPFTFTLFSTLPIRGYKYLFCLFNEKKKNSI